MFHVYTKRTDIVLEQCGDIQKTWVMLRGLTVHRTLRNSYISEQQSFVCVLYSCSLLFDRTDVRWLAEQKKECFAILCPRLKSNSYIVFDALTINSGWQTLTIKCCTCIKKTFPSFLELIWSAQKHTSDVRIIHVIVQSKYDHVPFGLVKVWQKIGHRPSRQSREDYWPHALQRLPGHCMNFHPHSDKDCFHLQTMCGHGRYPFLKADEKHNSVTEWVEIKANNTFTFIWRWAHHSLFTGLFKTSNGVDMRAHTAHTAIT